MWRIILNIGMLANGIKKSNLMFADFHFKIIHKYRISSNKRSCYLLNVEALRGSAYQREALKKARCLFQKKKGYIHIKFENFFIASFQIAVNNHYDI